MFYAHSENKIGVCETVAEHISEVSKLAGVFAGQWNRELEGKIAGLFHDLGKYTDAFQQVLKGACMVDHATPGAAAVLYRYKLDGIASAIAIEGHHDGLQYGDRDSLLKNLSMRDSVNSFCKSYSTKDFKSLINYLVKDNLDIPNANYSFSKYPELCNNKQYIAAMLYVRMLFSALVDADYLATEAHFQGDENGKKYRKKAEKLDAEAALKKLMEYKKSIEISSTANENINKIRRELFSVCCESAKTEKGIFTLTAPTGSGKTLAMLAFALHHASYNKQQRIIIVLPFLNIIEQTARVYKRILEHDSDSKYILEDHSLTDYDADESGNSRLFSENWDSPIIITTTVKFFESLFSNKPSACRKLHNIANSVIIFDEAQTMPDNLTIPTLSALMILYENYGCSIVFSTATQPAYESLNRFISGNVNKAWEPREIVPKELRLFERARRIEPVWYKECLSFDSLVEQVSDMHQALIIVNLKRHAQDLYRKLSAVSKNVYHISTYMCPSHRLDMLNRINKLLNDGLPCILVSTQCVEAGVDIDFPVVWRAMAPLEAIIQAAGRCNRNGRDTGTMYIFTPESDEEKYPGKDYKWGAITVKSMLLENDIDIYDTETIRAYYKKYYESIGIENKSEDLDKAVIRRDFPEVMRLYRWIPARGISVLVPYKAKMKEFEQLKDEAFNKGFSRSWARRAQSICVNVAYNSRNPIMDYITEVKVIRKGREAEGSGFYILLNSNLYSDDFGLDITCAGGEGFYIAE
ncbi:MAG TPA: CRISPR-associated helicase Cas3' [Candidatus Atribacteria bacterium]|nr:CRISPR-associated helicase Cas3' [Candidatus Atribacteria bacterium]